MPMTLLGYCPKRIWVEDEVNAYLGGVEDNGTRVYRHRIGIEHMQAVDGGPQGIPPGLIN